MIGQKTGGRAAGTPNRKTQELESVLKEVGFDPFKALIGLAHHKNPAIQLSALKEICSFIYPKRKSIEFVEENPFATMSEEEITNKVIEVLQRDPSIKIERINPSALEARLGSTYGSLK